MHETAVPHGREQERKGKIEAKNARTHVAIRKRYRVTGAEGYVFEGAAILAESDLAFRAAVQIVENRLRQTATRHGPKVIDAYHAWRGNCAGCSSHLRFQGPWLLKIARWYHFGKLKQGNQTPCLYVDFFVGVPIHIPARTIAEMGKQGMNADLRFWLRIIVFCP